MIRAFLIMAFAALTACGPTVVDPERVAQECEIRAQGAQGPTGQVTVGTNSRTGGFGGVSVGVTSDFLRGADPNAVYSDCVFRKSGQAPFRPPNLRDL